MVDKKRPPRLTETFIRSIKEPCKRGDGRGSHGLAIIAREKAGGGLSLFWQQRVLIDDKQRTIGLGNYPEITLKMARVKAFENARKLALGEDILKPKRVIPTLAEAFDALIALRTPEWNRKGEKKARQTVNQWNLSKDEYCSSILHKRVSDINAGDVMDVLGPIWIDKSATANNVQSHLKQVMDWAIRVEFRTTNPAVRSNLRLLGTQPPPVHHPAAPYQDLGQYLAQVRDSDAWWGEKYCLLFISITADRSGEAREATWDEVDMEKATLSIPAERMKGPDDHVVPLSTQAMEILRLAKRKGRHSRGTIFPPKRGGVFIDASNLSDLTKRLALPFVPHGVRSSFKDWVSENHPEARELAEMSLAHVVGNRVERAYRRTILLEQRRKLLQEYADFLSQTCGPFIAPKDENQDENQDQDPEQGPDRDATDVDGPAEDDQQPSIERQLSFDQLFSFEQIA